MKRLAIAVLLGLQVAATGCGGNDGRTLKVGAASSLKLPLVKLAATYPAGTLVLESGGSDKLAAAIRAGRRPDVFIAASRTQPDSLYADRLTGRPVAVAGNSLVIATRKGGPKFGSLADLGRRGVKIALGSKTVPIGSYADKALAKLPAQQRTAILNNVKSREPDASSVTAKLREGAVDAALLYRTDVDGSAGSLSAVAIPKSVAPLVTYFAAVVNGTKLPNASAALVKSLRSGRGQSLLRSAGFLPPPAK
ncbi:MAG: molybdate ABC transporter substrate-binding protein [Solirubrobacterales bacterium]|nr:molybdate ABC transporter substrate-binding protein [Solirubrobacterales bacterium]